MTSAEAESAARLLERLLSDPAYRARFRQNPVVASREAGLHSVAEEMAMGGGKALDTLDERQSRSSLAGVFMAAALEGVAMFDFSKEVLPYLDDLPPSVGNVAVPRSPAGNRRGAGSHSARPRRRAIRRARPERERRRGRISSGHPRAGGGCVGSRAGARPAARRRRQLPLPSRLRPASAAAAAERPRRPAHPPRRE